MLATVADYCPRQQLTVTIDQLDAIDCKAGQPVRRDDIETAVTGIGIAAREGCTTG